MTLGDEEAIPNPRLPELVEEANEKRGEERFRWGTYADVARELADLLDRVDDPDNGANGLQNFPVVTSVVVAAGQTTIEGLLNSTPSTTFTIQFYASEIADPGSFGEGQRYIGETVVGTDPAGNAPFTTILPVTVAGNEVVTATATGRPHLAHDQSTG